MLIAAALALPFAGDRSAADRRAPAATASIVARASAAPDGRPNDVAFPVDGPVVQRSLTIAGRYWSGDPCRGQVNIRWTPMDQGTNAVASWLNPTDAFKNPSENFECAITLNSEIAYDFAKLCTVLTHEVGHLMGQQHDPAPGRVMSAFYTDPIAECVEAASAAASPPAEDAATTTAASARQASATTSSKRRTLRRTRAMRCGTRFGSRKRTKPCARTRRIVRRAAKLRA